MRILRLGDRGNDVMEIQALLKKSGYNPGLIDGIFGFQTEKAVKEFQRDNGLTADGVIGVKTYALLEVLMRGYDYYIIQPGDTFYLIAQKYYTTVARIINANPGFNANDLIVGQKIIVPFGIDVVDTNINYTYQVLQRDIEGLAARYPFLETGIAGKSILGKNLYYIRIGAGPNQVFYNGAHHALEWITSPLLMKFTEDFAKSYADNKLLAGYDTRDIWEKSSIYIIPMVNPDGVDLVLNGLSGDNPYYNQLIEWNKGSSDFSRTWQANNRGVDLNHNYDALWQLSKAAEPEYGVYGPGPTRYSGEYPESEPESSAVADFVRAHNFRLAIAYHSQGEVIYWTFQNEAPPEARRIAEMFSTVSGYLLDEPTGITSYAGFKDWFIDKYSRPGYTIEVGRGVNPLPIGQFPEIYRDNIGILLLAALV